MDSPTPKMHDKRKITMTEDEQIFQRRILAAARKRQWHAQKQRCTLKYELIKEKNRVSTSKYDEMKKNIRGGMTEEELIADKKHLAKGKGINA